MTIVEQKNLAPRIFEMTLKGDLTQDMKTPGQFVHIRVPSNDLLLRRPISLAKIDKDNGTCTIIYRVEGEGTEIFSHMKVGDTLDVMGPLGNGFDIHGLNDNDTAFVIGGGIGTPPMYELARQLVENGVKVINLIGFASKEVLFYQEEFKALGETRFSTDDGSFGLHGHVGTLIDEALVEYGVPSAVYACGADGLLRAVDTKFETHERAYISMEERMACGMGACYACVVPLRENENLSLKICDEGPIFPTGKVVI